MYSIIILFIFIKIEIYSAHYLEAEANFLKPKLERNNIVNKGIWVKNKLKESLFEKTSVGDFIFRPNSADVDNILQNNFDAFGDNYLQDGPFLSSYVERTKRATNHIRKRHSRKSMKKCKNKNDCKYSKDNFKADSDDKEFISDLKPASVFNDYPYEVAILLNSNIKLDNNSSIDSITNKTEGNNNKRITKNVDDTVKSKVKKFKVDLNETKYNISNPKRNTKLEYESEDLKNFVLLDDYNKTIIIENNKERSIFDKAVKIWHQNAPMREIDLYKVVPKDKTNKPINERGLIKVISMLTKTFKKIMRQHAEIKTIHEQLQNINQEFLKNIAAVTNKFQDFDKKYNYLTKSNENLKLIEQSLLEREEIFKTKQKDMMHNLEQFENQQKKFFIQQKQFYSVQKFMLEQNDKINVKQTLIAKTQSEISHRQNNFARILKKAKQILDSRIGPSKYVSTFKYNHSTDDKVTHTTTLPEFTESIKINLFPLPTTNKIENQDEKIIKEKDDQAIDDLVYKFYFNNTFIDNVMRNKIFNTFVPEEKEVVNTLKNKRNELTTLLIPVKKMNLTAIQKSLKRNKRWISHKMRNSKRKSHLKAGTKDITKKQDLKNYTQNAIDDKAKPDPFSTMAKNFCNQIGQNSNQQILGWCVEKALRRLQYMDTKMFVKPKNTLEKEKEFKINKTEEAMVPLSIIKEITTAVPTTLQIVENSQVPPTNSTTPEDLQSVMFFPDNDELESNLKGYEIQPDTEGNVYYDGSLHTSDIVGPDTGSISDLMPGLDSNSKVDVDPVAFDLHARRRAFVQRLNANILKRMKLK